MVSPANSDDRHEWLSAVLFAVLLTAILSLQGAPAGREQAAFHDTAVCEKQSFPPLFFVFH
jgi:hypothetical protein